MRKMSSLHRALAAAMLLGLAGAPAAVGQAVPYPSIDVAYPVNSGMVGIAAPVVMAGEQAQLVWSQEISVPDASWLRVHFGPGTALSGDPAAGTGAYIAITSMLDGSRQVLNSKTLPEWDSISAFLNGDTVLVELFVVGGTGNSQVEITQVTAGQPGMQESICGPTDDRVPRNDPRQGRVSTGCTGWLITRDGFSNRFLTAGHCISTGQTGVVMHMNVPKSTSGGGLVNPPVEFQFPVQSASIQRIETQIGNDVATFNTNANSNTGLHAREAQGGTAYVLAGSAPAVSGQSILINGYGTVSSPVSLTWNQIQKTHTGPYTAKIAVAAGSRIEYATDTTGGNSGSPVVTTNNGLAIGIHTNAGCTSTGGANSGSGIENTNLQGYLNSPLGVTAAHPTDYACLTTLFTSNNGGSNGGAIYFDVAVGTEPLVVNALQLNINNAVVDQFFNFTVYTTPDTALGKENNAALWTQVTTGAGMPNPENTSTIGALKDTFVLQPLSKMGMAIVFDANAGHAYTNGTGSNEVYSNSNLTITGISASNAPFTGNIAGRVFNGGLCYNPGEQGIGYQCLTTLYAQNNSGSNGGMVYFDVTPAAGKTLTVTGFDLNLIAEAGVTANVKVYRRTGTHVGNTSSSAGWTLVANGVGTTAGPNLPTPIILDEWFLLSAGTLQALAIEASHNGVATGAHAYTNGTGSNQNYSNADLSIATGAATNTPFAAGAPFSPRVFNGSICYGVNIGTCAGPFAQLAPNPSLGGWNSNIAGGIASTQQVADNFTLNANYNLTGMEVYGVYTGTQFEPSNQDFETRFFLNSGGLPGANHAIRTNANVTIEDTGLIMTGFSPNRKLYKFDYTFSTPVQVNANTTYWVSPVGNETNATWCWQHFVNAGGSCAIRANPTAAWNSFPQNLAFKLCGTVAPPCYADCDQNGTLNIFDYICFGNAYSAQTAYGDCDGNGAWNIFDYICYGNAFSAGCP